MSERFRPFYKAVRAPSPAKPLTMLGAKTKVKRKPTRKKAKPPNEMGGLCLVTLALT
jgi:hypothetical protein